jgi:hypothetical protein
MTVDEVYQLISYCVNKYQGSQPSPDEFNDVLMPNAQNGYAQFLIGEYQSYQTQRPQARISFGQNQNVRESLTPIIYGYILNADANGIAPYPGDYQKTDAMTTIYGFNRIRFISQDRLFFAMNDVNSPVATNPVYLVKDIGFQFYPTTITQARLSYIRNPPPIYWGYTLDVNDLPVWNPATSIDPIWADTDIMEICVRALRLIGVNLQSNVISQYANEIKATGQ